jgi:hypothetical protein
MMCGQKKKHEIRARLNIHHTSQYCAAQETDTVFQYEQQHTTITTKHFYVSFHLFSNNTVPVCPHYGIIFSVLPIWNLFKDPNQ